VGYAGNNSVWVWKKWPGATGSGVSSLRAWWNIAGSSIQAYEISYIKSPLRIGSPVLEIDINPLFKSLQQHKTQIRRERIMTTGLGNISTLLICTA
jgi:hypothetical protein